MFKIYVDRNKIRTQSDTKSCKGSCNEQSKTSAPLTDTFWTSNCLQKQEKKEKKIKQPTLQSYPCFQMFPFCTPEMQL